MKFRVYFDDTDAMGIVYHANYLRFCERARSEAFFRAGCAHLLTSGAKSGGGFVIASASVNWHASAKLGDIIRVSTRLIALHRASCELEHKIFLCERAGCDFAVCGDENHPKIAHVHSDDNHPEISGEKLLFSARVKLAHINAAGRASAIPDAAAQILSRL